MINHWMIGHPIANKPESVETHSFETSHNAKPLGIGAPWATVTVSTRWLEAFSTTDKAIPATDNSCFGLDCLVIN